MPFPPVAQHWLTLSLLPGLGCGLISRLVAHYGGAEAVLRHRGRGCSVVVGVGPRLQEVLADQAQVERAHRQADTALARLADCGGQPLCPEMPQYPRALLTIADPPALLFCRGDLSLLSLPAVALIGARAASDYGRRVAGHLAAELVSQGVAVVSGAAYGIDAAAHQGALQAGGPTIAVLGCGLDIAYPKAHASLLADIAASGLILSEYPLGTPPDGFRFPARNRIISGLSAGVVVVEATEKSGSLITASLALDQGREVFAVPGRVDSLKSAGSHWLIRQGALLVRHAGDILESLDWRQPAPAAASASAPNGPDTIDLSADERQLWAALDVYPQDIDTLGRRSSLPVTALHGLLLQLELRGLIRQLPGQLYERRGEG